MLYSYQYDIAGTIVSGMLLFIFIVRNTYQTKSSKMLFLLILTNLIACIADCWSAFTISFPTEFSPFARYITNAAYLFTYNSESILFLLFVVYSIKAPRVEKAVRIYGAVMLLFEFIVIATSPLTKLIFYFDGNLNYCHGGLMFSLYVVAALGMIASAAITFIYRKEFSRYQVMSLVGFLAAMLGCVIFQMLYPKYLIGTLVAACVLMFIYVVFENPAVYLYGSSRCYNSNAFTATINDLCEDGTPYSVTACSFEDYSYLRSILGKKYVDEISLQLAGKLHLKYGKRAFCLGDSTYAVINTDGTDEFKVTKAELRELSGTDRTLRFCRLESKDIPEAEEYITDVLDHLLATRAETMSYDQIYENVVKAKKRLHLVEFVLRDAIKNEQFTMYYQPIYDIHSKSFVSAEALVRLNIDTDKYGFIGPDEFIPVAENNGSIFQVDEIVMKKVFSFISTDAFKDLGLEFIDVNLSAVQCVRENMAEYISNFADQYNIDYSYLNLEITETAEMCGSESLIENMNILSNKGVRFSIDDFGTGFATGDYLYRLPVSHIKIDKCVLWEAMKDEGAMNVLTDTISMMRKVCDGIVVEGVENEEMKDLLIEKGADYLQGYLFSKPLPEDEFIKFIKASKA